jgi:ABC-type bacteriocin/lantibiotic exporter with double-glycine peptidase domain
MNKLLITIIILNQILISSVYHNKKYAVPENYTIQSFPTITQPDDISCGPTGCVMVARYFGKNLSIQEAKKIGKTTWFKYKGKEIGMTSPDNIPIILGKIGIFVDIEKGNLNKLQYYVSHNKPILVLVRTSSRFWHYVVVIGYDKNKVCFSDPGNGEICCLPNKVFLGAWNFSGDLQGNKIPTNLQGLLVQWADVQGNLMFVPK